MTVSTTENRKSYAGNGVTSVFSFPYVFFADADLVVLKVKTDGTFTKAVLGTDYTVSGAGSEAGGSITMTAPPAAGTTLVIYRDPQLTQPMAFVDNDPLPAKSVSRGYDRLTVIAQRIRELVDRSFRLSDADNSGASPIMPPPTPNAFIGWNGAGNGLVNRTISDLITVSAFGTAVADKFVGNGTAKDFTLSQNPGATANLDVAIGGVVQTAGKDFTWDGANKLSFVSAPPAPTVPGDTNIYVRYLRGLPLGYSDASLVNYTFGITGTGVRSIQDRLRAEPLRVSDFVGADPTGASDSYAALQAAIDASPTGGTLIVDGDFRSGQGLIVTRQLTLQGVSHRVGNVVSAAVSRSFITFDAGVGTGLSVNDCVVTLDGVTLSGPGTGTGVLTSGGNNSLALVGGSVVQNFEIGVKLSGGYYNTINQATITFCKACLVVDYVYNLTATALTIRAASVPNSTGITLLNGSRMTMLGGSVENATANGISLFGAGSGVNLDGTYFENSGGWNVYMASSTSVNAIGCHVYLNTGCNRFISVESASTFGTRVFSRNHRFMLPTNTDAATIYAPNPADYIGYWDVAGDVWPSDVGPNVQYVVNGFVGMVGTYKIEFPNDHPKHQQHINTVPFCTTPATATPGSPSDGAVVNCANQGFGTDDPLGLHTKPWGYGGYMAIWNESKQRWEKLGVRINNQPDSVATTVSGLKDDFNNLLAYLRASGAMV